MNTMIRRRLAGLESLVVIDCETCRFWYGTVLKDDASNVSRPETCPACGRVVAITCEVHIVGVPLDLL